MRWELIFTIISIITTALAGGLALKFIEATKKLIKESREFRNVLHDALADKQITREEIFAILDEFDDIPLATIELLKVFNK